MKRNDNKEASGGGVWGHVLVTLCACILTVSIAGSAVYLGWRVYDRRQLKARVEAEVASLENRTPEELAERADYLKARPKLAKYVLPEIVSSITKATSEQQKCSAIQVAKAFLDHKRIEKILFRLRKDPRESVAAASVNALSAIEPRARAAEVIGHCLVEATASAAVDEACVALYRMGQAGREEMSRRVPELEIGRRIWLVRYVGSVPGPDQRSWLDMLSRDEDPRVRAAAAGALERLAAKPRVQIGERPPALVVNNEP